MHDMMKKVKAGDRESIALILLDAPDRESGKDEDSPEDYAMSIMGNKEKKMDPLKKSILSALDPMGMPEGMQMEVCKIIYDAIKSGSISSDGSSDEPEESSDEPEEGNPGNHNDDEEEEMGY